MILHFFILSENRENLSHLVLATKGQLILRKNREIIQRKLSS